MTKLSQKTFYHLPTSAFLYIYIKSSDDNRQVLKFQFAFRCQQIVTEGGSF